MKNGFKWMVVLLVGASFAHAADSQPVELMVDLDTVLFEDFLGVNAVYQAFAWMPETKAKGFDEADVQRELDRIERMDLQMARTWYRPDWAVGENTIAGPFDWESPKMKAFYKWLGAMKEMNVDVALQAGWGFTKDMHVGREFADPERDPAEYAAWVSESIHQLVNVRGFDHVKYLILMTEPTTSPWAERPKEKSWPDYVSVKRGEQDPEDLELWPYYVKVMRGLHEKMLEDGTRKLVQFVGPNNHAVNSFDDLRLNETLEQLADVFDIYGAHSYLPPENAYEGWKGFLDQVRETLTEKPKPIWLDEYNVLREWEHHVRDQPAHGTYIAELIAASLDAKIQNTMIWSLFDQQYPAPLHESDGGNSFVNGVHRWGTAKFPYDTQDDPTEPYPVWYAFSMLSKYLGGGEGTKVYECKGADGIRMNAIEQTDGTWRFLVINSTPEAKSFSISFSRELGGSLERHLYDPANVQVSEAATIPEVDKVFEHAGRKLSDRLPAGGVAVYVGINRSAP
jgi:hypothetical protein